MRRGRPRNPTKSVNRRITIIPSEKAYRILEEIKKKRQDGLKFLHQYFSEHIIRDFENNPKALILREIADLEKQRDEVIEKLMQKAMQLKKISNAEQEKLIEEEFKTVGIRQ